MNKTAFMNKLDKCLKHLPKEDREDAITYYREYFEEMGALEDMDVTKEVGQPEEVAKEIIANCTQKHIDAQKENGGIKSSAMVIWMIILAIFASPIAVPTALVGVVLFFCAILIVVILVLSVAVVGIALLAAGVILLVALFIAGSIGQGMVCAGAGLISLSLGGLVLIASVKLIEFCIRTIAALFKKIFFRKKVA